MLLRFLLIGIAPYAPPCAGIEGSEFFDAGELAKPAPRPLMFMT